MEWLDALRRLDDEGAACVLVTLTAVRGHAPRAAGAKMVVSRDGAWDTVGGGNLEATLTDRARRMLEDGESEPCSVTIPLNEHARTRYGRQCCGGEVAAFLEPLRAMPVVAVFGAGHVGLELARALHRLPVAVELVDSRAAAVDAVRALDALEGPARIRGHHAPAPEGFLRDLPAGSHVRIMTHDHAEDLVLCDAALRREDLGSIGLIGSSAKWVRFRKMLREQGHDDAAIARIACPIGLPGVTGKAPAVIALSVAAELAEAVRAPRREASRGPGAG
ncbi:xanthine dehydrogenase accessory protein XdhC [Rothia sp. AR01]|uniref:Xanthine dehydrogenase accessory protein XdhC n=1 Tax=Rothia santali TaxID=2949643 RepID=A0A9X2HL36_9MICC|nr:xanthine dehydrogenase accessory protein XdhC [Rothia santali]MCP3426933.1 xanthine dehydrogenase accessory protein XdhC [Rothia santali]